MVAVVWITESTWEACIDHARRLIPDDAQVTLVHISRSDVEDLMSEGVEGLLGRPSPPRPQRAPLAIAAEQAQALLETARARFARPAKLRALRGHPERDLLRECAAADLLLLARGGDDRLGPKSFSREARFIVDHAACAVLVVWAQWPVGPR